jgi:hypothetical protein
MAMSKNNFSNNLDRLHAKEQSLRQEALEIIQGQPKLLLHLDAIDAVMTLARLLVDYPKNEEDFNVVKMLSVRMFNAFGASLELITTGYHQNAGLPMRDTLETLFLLDLVVSSFYTVKNGERCGISLHGNKHNIHTQEGIQPRLLTGFTFPLPTAYL